MKRKVFSGYAKPAKKSRGIVKIRYPVRRATKSELKGLDTDIAASSILATTNTNGNTLVLNLTAPGTGSFNRIGRKIRLKSVRLTGIMTTTFHGAAVSNDVNSQTVRMVLVWDKQPSGVLPTFDTIFGNTVQDGTEATNFLNGLRYDNTDRFRVLRDVVKDFNPSAYNSGAGTTNLLDNQCYFDEFVKLKGLETVFSAQNAAPGIADISSGALYLIYRAETNSASVCASVTSAATARLRYYDA